MSKTMAMILFQILKRKMTLYKAYKWIALRQNQVTTCMCQKLQLKNGSLRYSSQTFDLPASDSGLRMSSSRIAPPPPPATVIVSINNNVTCFEVEMVLENASIVRPGDQNKEGTNLRWASMGHRATHHWSVHLELMEVGRVCSIFRCLVFSSFCLCCIIIS